MVMTNVKDMVKLMGVGFGCGRRMELSEKPRFITEDHIKNIKDKGFKHVRLLIHWGEHTGMCVPYTVEPEWFEKVDAVIDLCLKNQLIVVLSSSDEAWIDNVKEVKWKAYLSRYK